MYAVRTIFSCVACFSDQDSSEDKFLTKEKKNILFCSSFRDSDVVTVAHACRQGVQLIFNRTNRLRRALIGGRMERKTLGRGEVK